MNDNKEQTDAMTNQCANQGVQYVKGLPGSARGPRLTARLSATLRAALQPRGAVLWQLRAGQPAAGGQPRAALHPGRALGGACPLGT
eukprot:1189706-Prorocentrum_minimum.AAC.2